MNKSFMLLDKQNNLQKTASVVVKFNFEGKDYLVYSVDENEQNNQIFVSRLVLNSEGKIFIDNILPEEKGKLNNIVYNIVILIPSEVQKGSKFDDLMTNLFDKFSVKLSSNISDMDIQEYFSNCSVAITSKVLVETAIKFYDENLNKKIEDNSTVIPTWTAPVEATAPVPATLEPEKVIEPVSIDSVVHPVQDSVVVANLDLQSNPVESSSSVPTPANEVVDSTPVMQEKVDNVQPNPQIEKLAIVSDPSLGIGVAQTNVGRNKKAGFANTKYIVIGTVCLLLAVAVVIIAYVLISNMK